MKHEMSYFNPPIAPIRDARGRFQKGATMTPHCTVSVEQVYNFIKNSQTLRQLTEEVRNAPDYKSAKTTRLPFVTPCGVFSERKTEGLLTLSGLIPLDIDGLGSFKEAEMLKYELFNDPYLMPVLCFVSPSGRGVKAFLPHEFPKGTDPYAPGEVTRQVKAAMEYVQMQYGGCDTSGSDVTRCCLLCHDAKALFNSSFLILNS